MPVSYSRRDDKSLFHLLLDRQSALDIGAFVIDGCDLSPGSAVPSDGDSRIDRALPGFFFTCGPDHIRHPEPIGAAGGGRFFPLHGSLCGTPVTWAQMSDDPARPGCRAHTDVTLADGGKASVERVWSVDREGPSVTLSDHVTNTGNTPFAPMIMYHMNFAAALFDAETRISGRMMRGGDMPWRFGEGASSVVCMPAEAPDEDGFARVSLGPIQAIGGRCLHLRFAVEALPFLQIWRCQRDGANVFSLEPVSHRLAQRAELVSAGEMPLLLPGETKHYRLAFHAG